MRFSERMGFVKARTAIQLDSIDLALRNSLWNVVYQNYMRIFDTPYLLDRGGRLRAEALWAEYFKAPLNQIPASAQRVLEAVSKYFLKDAEWHQVYDFMEFVYEDLYAEDEKSSSEYQSDCNSCLEKEKSGYRLVSGKLVAITSNEELKAIDEAQTTSGNFSPAAVHIQAALTLFADRKNPDYRNSIKEAISAVESVCKEVAADNKATLGEALKKLEKSGVNIHPALKQAFNNLYGYTNDAGGIRHALLEEENLNFEDAKFMLVACSAFVNYLKSKTG